jgi:hypothetical protein
VARVPGLVREIIEAETDARFDRSHFAAITDQALAVETVYFVTSGDYRLFMDPAGAGEPRRDRAPRAAGLGLTLPTRAVVVRPGADGANGSTPPVPFATSVAAAGGATDP